MHKAETAKPINTLSFIDRGLDSRNSLSIICDQELMINYLYK